MKKIFFSAFIFSLFTLAACSSSDDDYSNNEDYLIGVWEYIQEEGYVIQDGVRIPFKGKDPDFDQTYNFNSNHTGTEVYREDEYDGNDTFTWTYNESTRLLTMDFGGSEVITWKVAGLTSDRLYLEDKDVDTEYGYEYYIKLTFRKK